MAGAKPHVRVLRLIKANLFHIPRRNVLQRVESIGLGAIDENVYGFVTSGRRSHLARAQEHGAQPLNGLEHALVERPLEIALREYVVAPGRLLARRRTRRLYV